MWIDYQGSDHIALKRPALIVAVSTSIPQYRGLYSQARELADYMLSKMKFKKIATVRASAFLPEVILRDDGTATLPECGLYLSRGTRDILLFAGDSSPMDEQYEFAEFILAKAADFRVKELYSVGARWAENPLPPDSDPLALGFATDAVGVGKLRNSGVKILSEEPAPFFASMVVAMAKDYGIRGYKLAVDHGEPNPHVKSVARILEVLSRMAEFQVDLDELRSKAVPAVTLSQSENSSIYH
ncbi:MAG: PAC2 family protein [Nitrososphaerota archaeon]|jgi:proteasome assembly chaperone (PAC2) family protein|nr:PAC2 family protein [Nitrososphaerota archaeon]MDG6942300.1 PAC2 family protein [Nitrososphaerota archaeon]MDG6942765.1 PAC2 family protein [Nitrososphaerota archaeon]MDG6948552.1 PAC2 family protein [Nitrososphaerota archaeon]MDG6950478.1 PAC2 family protein [Nitrososphaerota archaeon]